MPNPTRRMQHLFYRFEDYKEKTHHNFVVYAIRITAVWWTRITSLSSTHSDDMYIEPTPVTAVVKWRSPLISEQEVWNLLKVAEHSFAGSQQ